MQKRFQPYRQQDFMVVKDALLATISHPYFKLKPILKEKRDALKQELIEGAFTAVYSTFFFQRDLCLFVLLTLKSTHVFEKK